MELPSGKANIGAQVSLKSLSRTSWSSYGWQGALFYPLNKTFGDQSENKNAPGWLRFIFTIMAQFVAPLIYVWGFLLVLHFLSTLAVSPTTAADLGIRSIIIGLYVGFGYYLIKIITHDTRYRVYLLPSNALASAINKEVGIVVGCVHAGLILAAAVCAGIISKKMLAPTAVSTGVLNGAGAALTNAVVSKTLFWFSTSAITCVFIFMHGFWNQDSEGAAPPSPNAISHMAYIATGGALGVLTVIFSVVQLVALDSSFCLGGILATNNHVNAAYWVCISLFASAGTAVVFYLIKSMFINAIAVTGPLSYKDDGENLPSMSSNVAGGSSKRLRQRNNKTLNLNVDE